MSIETMEVKKELEISLEHKKEIDSMEDNQLVETWKVYISKAKRLKETTKEGEIAKTIANYAMKRHKENRMQMIA